MQLKNLDTRFLDAITQMDFSSFLGLITLMGIDIWKIESVDFPTLLDEVMKRYRILKKAQKRHFLKLAKAGKKEK